MYDSHMHSNNSNDGRQTLDEICQTAISKNLSGVSITDHVHIAQYEKWDIYNSIKSSIADTRAAQEKYADRLKVLCGIEIGEPLVAPDKVQEIMGLTDYDVVLGAIHFVQETRWACSTARVVFDDSITDAEIYDYVKLYYEQLNAMIDNLDFDVLAHVTYPFRYISGKYKRAINYTTFWDEIVSILKKIIEKGIALEVNTSSLKEVFQYMLVPNAHILRTYYEMGGCLITLGSDAHRSEFIGHKFEEAITVLKEIGFEYYCYYEKRKPVKVYI